MLFKVRQHFCDGSREAYAALQVVRADVLVTYRDLLKRIAATIARWLSLKWCRCRFSDTTNAYVSRSYLCIDEQERPSEAFQQLAPLLVIFF